MRTQSIPAQDEGVREGGREGEGRLVCSETEGRGREEKAYK